MLVPAILTVTEYIVWYIHSTTCTCTVHAFHVYIIRDLFRVRITIKFTAPELSPPQPPTLPGFQTISN